VSQQFDSHPESEQSHLTDDGVQQMLLLAERLRESSGGVLDDAAILAVSEATGAPPEYVRLALRMRPLKKRASLTDKIRNDFLTLEPDTRRYVAATAAAVATGSFLALGARFGDQYQIYGLLTVLAITGGLYNVAVSKDTKIAAFSGALLAGLSCVSFAVLAALLKVSNPPPTAILLIPLSLAGGLCGLIIHKLVDSYRGKIGLSDPVKERQDLLRQLVDTRSLALRGAGNHVLERRHRGFDSDEKHGRPTQRRVHFHGISQVRRDDREAVRRAPPLNCWGWHDPRL
jgi:hypothetical protein